MATVYLSAKLPKVATEILNKAAIHYEVFDGTGLISKDELIKHVKDCKVLITPLSTQVDQDLDIQVEISEMPLPKQWMMPEIRVKKIWCYTKNRSIETMLAHKIKVPFQE